MANFTEILSHILFDSQSVKRNINISSEEDTGGNATGNLMLKCEDNYFNEKERENEIERERHNDNNEEGKCMLPLSPEQVSTLHNNEEYKG